MPHNRANTNPLVTVAIPVYNHESFVAESIRSVIGQSYTNLELIIINDGSEDRSHELVVALTGDCKRRFSRFEYINRENRGLSATLNEALSWSEGKYFSPLASDDVFLPEKLGVLAATLERGGSDSAAVFSNAAFIDEAGRAIYLDQQETIQYEHSNETYATFLDFYTRGREFDYRTEFGSYLSLLQGNYIPAMAALLKTELLRQAGGWTVGNPLEDWEMWLKLSRYHKLLYVDKVTALYRLHGLNTVFTRKRELRLATQALLMKEKEYCRRNGLMREWSDITNGSLYWMLRYGGFSPKEVNLSAAGLVSLAGFLARESVSRLWQIAGRNPGHTGAPPMYPAD